MPKIAVVKPDHLGDLVLASPALRVLHSHASGDITFFVSPATVGLLRFIFPNGERVSPVQFPHLSKGKTVAFDRAALANDLNEFDQVFFLRDDRAMREVGELLDVAHMFTEGGHLTHETAIQKRAIARWIGGYSRTSLFSGPPILWPRRIAHVGLCISAGFPTNRWPNSYWLALATSILARGVSISLIGGPDEADDLRLLSRLLSHKPHQIVQGSADFGRFFSEIDPIDLIVASDGGSAHLCSLKKPMLSIFGSSPWRRYAPFGWSNVVLTRDLPCNPCLQFSVDEVNGCLSRECMTSIRPSTVAAAIFSNGLDFSMVRGATAVRGVSHKFED